MNFVKHLHKFQKEGHRYYVHEQAKSSIRKANEGFRKMQDELNPVTATIDDKSYEANAANMIKVIAKSLFVAERLSQCKTINDMKKKEIKKKDCCSEVRKGMKKQMEVDDAMDIDNCEEYEELIYDSITGKVLDPALVKEARTEEVEYYRSMNVYSKVDRRMAYEKTGKALIKMRWVDHNKRQRRETNDKKQAGGKGNKNVGHAGPVRSNTAPGSSKNGDVAGSGQKWRGQVSHAQ